MGLSLVQPRSGFVSYGNASKLLVGVGIGCFRVLTQVTLRRNNITPPQIPVTFTVPVRAAISRVTWLSQIVLDNISLMSFSHTHVRRPARGLKTYPDRDAKSLYLRVTLRYRLFTSRSGYVSFKHYNGLETSRRRRSRNSLASSQVQFWTASWRSSRHRSARVDISRPAQSWRHFGPVRWVLLFLGPDRYGPL